MVVLFFLNISLVQVAWVATSICDAYGNFFSSKIHEYEGFFFFVHGAKTNHHLNFKFF